MSVFNIFYIYKKYCCVKKLWKKKLHVEFQKGFEDFFLPIVKGSVKAITWSVLRNLYKKLKGLHIMSREFILKNYSTKYFWLITVRNMKLGINCQKPKGLS